jgi:hypothetical protein
VVRRGLLRSGPLSGPWGDRKNAPAMNTSDLGMERIAEQGVPLRNTMLLLYSPNLGEGVFYEVRRHGVLGSSPVEGTANFAWRKNLLRRQNSVGSRWVKVLPVSLPGM